MRIAVVSLGSRGDLYQLLGVARSLRERGHDVTMFEKDEYRDDVGRTGLRFTSLGPGSACQRVFERCGDTAWALVQLIRVVAVPSAPASVRAILADGPFDAVVAHHFQLAGQLAAELLGARFVSVTGRDVVDLYHPPVDAAPTVRQASERTLRMVDGLGTPALNTVRRSFGLPERRHASTVASLSSEGVVVLCSRLFLDDTSSWPEHFRIAGCPDYEGRDNLQVPDQVSTFLDRTELGPLIVCTLGDSWANAYPPSCENLAVAAERLGARVLYLVCRGSVQATGPRCLIERFVPLSRIVDDVAAIVHHAGRGSLMTGLRAGLPALMLPHWLDGFDNARRAAELGVGRVIPDDLDASELSAELAAVLHDPRYRVAAGAAARMIAADPDPGLAVEDILLERDHLGVRGTR